ncbi:MAG TPA: SRPBCC family protein, partial [Propionibacteriaceae bacterium]
MRSGQLSSVPAGRFGIPGDGHRQGPGAVRRYLDLGTPGDLSLLDLRQLFEGRILALPRLRQRLINEPIYNPRMLHSEKITDGPVGVGTRFRATAQSGRREIEMLIEVTEYQRPSRFGSRTTMSTADVDGGLTFEPVDGATGMSWSWDVRPRGSLRLLAP